MRFSLHMLFHSEFGQSQRLVLCDVWDISYMTSPVL